MSNVNRSSQSKFKTVIQVFSLISCYLHRKSSTLITVLGRHDKCKNLQNIINKAGLFLFSSHPPSPHNLLGFLCETVCGDFFWKRSYQQNTAFYLPSFFTGNVWFSRSVQRELAVGCSSQKRNSKPNPKKTHPSSAGFNLSYNFLLNS